MTISSSPVLSANPLALVDSRSAMQAEVADVGRAAGNDLATKMLKTAAASWFTVAVLGQLLFVAYVVRFYGRTAAQGRFDTWNEVLPHGYVAGDTFGNLIVMLHLLFATFVIVGGALQLLPALRRVAPRFHHWNGRVYLLSAAVLSVGGLIMVWTRGAVGDQSQHIAISLNAVLILAFAAMALRHALARRFDQHRRWALRLFLAVSGVWFFRIGLMLWIVANQGPAGFDPATFSGPFLTVLAFAQYLLPLAMLQLYFHAQDRAGSRGRFAMAAGLGVGTLLMAAGIAAATMLMWLPRM